MCTDKLDRVLRELRDGVTQIYGARLVGLVLFGSQARNDAKPDSDIDVMVVLRGPVNPHEEIGGCRSSRRSCALKYEVVISCVYVSEERFSQDQSPLMLNVRREGVAV
jgi:hypothetical protein